MSDFVLIVGARAPLTGCRSMDESAFFADLYTSEVLAVFFFDAHPFIAFQEAETTVSTIGMANTPVGEALNYDLWLRSGKTWESTFHHIGWKEGWHCDWTLSPFLDCRIKWPKGAQ